MRNALQKHKMSDKIKWIITFVIGIGLIASTIALTVRLNNSETTKTLSTSAYTVGILSDVDGKAESGQKGGLFTETYYDLENAEIKFKDNASVSVYANLYTENKTFLQVIKVTGDGKVSDLVSGVSNAKYVRFEIIPDEDADGEVGFWEKSEYAGQVTITVNK